MTSLFSLGSLKTSEVIYFKVLAQFFSSDSSLETHCSFVRDLSGRTCKRLWRIFALDIRPIAQKSSPNSFFSKEYFSKLRTPSKEIIFGFFASDLIFFTM